MSDNLIISIKAALEAGKEILEIYQTSDFEVEMKSDNSPLTIADKKAHTIISGHLEKTGIPILSEEGRNIPYEERKKWEYLWIVDPLDGTKEFIKRNGEFTVNIALVKDKSPILGVVYAPLRKLVYFSDHGLGAFRLAHIEPFDENNFMDYSIQLPHIKSRKRYTVVGSRSHMNDETTAFIKKLKAKHGKIEIISSGSALKLCQVAEGSADIYPRFAPTMEWDTAAGQAVVEAAGGRVTKTDGIDSLIYNKADLLNPFFIVSN